MRGNDRETDAGICYLAVNHGEEAGILTDNGFFR